MRSKVEKEKHAKSLQIEEVRAAMDLVANERATLEKQDSPCLFGTHLLLTSGKKESN